MHRALYLKRVACILSNVPDRGSQSKLSLKTLGASSVAIQPPWAAARPRRARVHECS